MESIFKKEVSDVIVSRINKLSAETKPLWGKMSVDQMCAHCCVAYEMVYTPEKFKKPGAFGKFMIKLFAKNMVVGSKPYPKNGRTAPDFVISDKRNFESEKNKLIGFINQTQKLGEDHFDNKESFAMGPLTKDQWNVLFHKHIDHHLKQFDV